MLALLLCGAISCIHEEPVTIPPAYDIKEELKEPIVFSVLDTITKVTDVISLNSFYVVAYSLKRESVVWSQEFSYNDDMGGYVGDKYWPENDLQYMFYASNVMFTNTATAELKVYNTKDVVFARQVYSSSYYKNEVPLHFEHIFAKIGYCRIIPPSGYSVSNAKVQVLAGSYGSYYGNGTWLTYQNTTYTLTDTIDSTISNDILVIPATYTLNLSYILTKDAYRETFTKSVPVTLVAGKTNNIILNLPDGNDSGAPGGGVVIDPWEGGGDVGESM